VHGLFEEHGRCVYTLCRHLLRDPHEAEDAAQQTFLSAHRSILGGTAPRDPAGWLAAIARNECRGRIHARMAEPLPLGVTERVGDAVEEVARCRADVRELYDAITELPDPQREAVVMREICGLSYDEMSERSGLPVSAVKSVLFRARQSLRSRLSSARALASAGSIALTIRDSLVQALAGSGSGEAAGTVVKLASLPVAAKIAAATTSVAIVGTLGAGSAPRSADTVPSAKRERAAATTREARSRPNPTVEVAGLAAAQTSTRTAEHRPAADHSSASTHAVVRTTVARPAAVEIDPSGRARVANNPEALDESGRSQEGREPSWRQYRCGETSRSTSWRGSWSLDDRDRSGRCYVGSDDQSTLPEPDDGTGAGEDDGGLLPQAPEVPDAQAAPEVPAEQPTAPEAPSVPSVGQDDGSGVDAEAPAEPAKPVDPAIS
jgi:RNA polymerase sigma-70 factor (ECF subfamily)